MDDSAALAAKLSSEGEKVAQFMEGLSALQQEAVVYTEGTTWTARNVLAHLMSAERAFLRLFQQIREGGGGVSMDFSIDRYNASQQRKMQELSWQDLLEAYRAARKEMVGLVGGLTGEDLDKQGRHPFLGLTTLREMVKMLYIHNQTHYRDVRRSLKPE